MTQSGYHIFDSQTDSTELDVVYCSMTLPYSIDSMDSPSVSIPKFEPARFIVEQNTNSTYDNIVENG